MNQQSASDKKGDFQIKTLSRKQNFSFSCHQGIQCYNRCCYQIDIILTPFDILNIKAHLAITSSEFLDQYCLFQNIKGTQVPLIKLKPIDDEKRSCRFVDDKGCQIYNLRPLVCRSYPIGLSVVNEDLKPEDEKDFIIIEDICYGHREKKIWSVQRWKKDQRVIELEQDNLKWMNLVNRMKTLRLSGEEDKKMEFFIMACYDIDTFKSFVFNSSFFKRFEISPEKIKKLEANEKELLVFGLSWLDFALFSEGDLKPKKI
ncbi:MAG: YkgJ family cysteine cluster protein [Deltaproteobacteria bacterium]|nr:YkgJ family cysteine cluster protein [Deltaproteobacteria bacterium]